MAQVADVAQVFGGEQAAALGSIQSFRYADADAYRVVGIPIRLDRSTLPYPCPAPELGADTRRVLIDLGLTAADVDGLVATGIAIAP